ncbi:ACT domain-containing protein [Corynebacterium tapiri]|uniref:ACT domain-containing protein n=1 Tax=Corynebacterium tapiri TaxID=1448266 RepID=A0A5C4U3H6_9CORY|nr:ACT domain-containing protein [Corynebacterium tapiri]TNL97587.1 ACT domain-containing protein [Corynebacterium tapiri]
MIAIMTVTGADRTGIIAAVTTELARQNVNILNVSQMLMDDLFTMILRVDLGDLAIEQLQASMDALGTQEKLVIRVQSEALFTAVNEV